MGADVNHDPNNRNCDKTQYGDAEGVRCTCDVDSPEDGGPSIVMPDETYTPPRGLRDRMSPRQPAGGPVTLTGRAAQLHQEFVAAAGMVRAAQRQYEVAKQRWSQALDAYTNELAGE